MSINANKKFIDAILNRVSDYKIASQRQITDLSELNDIMETATGDGYSLSFIKRFNKFIGANAKEFCYDNGLKYLISKINYKAHDNNVHTIEQRTLTSNYSNTPIVNIIIEKERKAIQQLF